MQQLWPGLVEDKTSVWNTARGTTRFVGRQGHSLQGQEQKLTNDEFSGRYEEREGMVCELVWNVEVVDLKVVVLVVLVGGGDSGFI